MTTTTHPDVEANPYAAASRATARARWNEKAGELVAELLPDLATADPREVRDVLVKHNAEHGWLLEVAS